MTDLMLGRTLNLFSLVLLTFLLSSCDKGSHALCQSNIKKDKATCSTPVERGPHQYGGWFCPDNFGGFPPMDIQDINGIEVVEGRLPTKEETQNGKSLILVDLEKYPDAKALDMPLPRLGKIYSSYHGMDELVVVIQAIVVGTDTIVGYRFPSGGNGSAWYDQVELLETDDVLEMGSMPYVYLHEELDADRKEVWAAIASSTYGSELAERFDKKEFFNSDWMGETTVHLEYKSENGKATGVVTSLWGNLYIQVDYFFNGNHSTEKVLLIENTVNNTVELHFAAGPFPHDIGSKRAQWNDWLHKIKSSIKMN